MKYLREHAAAKSVAAIVLLLSVFCAVISQIGYSSFSDTLMEQYASGAFLVADTAARLVDADRMDAYADSGGETEEYRQVLAQLDALCASSGSTFIYVIRPDRSDYAHITFLFSAARREGPYPVYDFGYVRQTTNDDYRTKYRALYEQDSGRELVIRDKGFIETDPHITAMIGLRGADGQVKALLCVQRQMDTMVRLRHTLLRKVLTALVILVALVAVGDCLFLHRALLRPLRLISDEALRFSVENRRQGEPLQSKIRSRDEVGRLAASIDQMEQQLQAHVERQMRAAAERERMQSELDLAARIQNAMLPHAFPAFPDREEFDVYAVMDPAREVGGDFYDFFLIDEDHLGLVMADVSGKGIPAALFMMASRIILQSVAMLGSSPAEVLNKTNEAICSNNEAQMFVTVWMGILELSTGRLTAANAGHECPALREPGGAFTLYRERHGVVLGVMDAFRYRESVLTLRPGTKLFLYTDGVTEATGPERELFGTKRMVDALNEQPDAAPEQILRNVRASVNRFVRDAEQFDDLTMLCIEYRGTGNSEQRIAEESASPMI